MAKVKQRLFDENGNEVFIEESEWELIWENDKPYSSFPKTTLNINIERYKMFKIVCNFSGNANNGVVVSEHIYDDVDSENLLNVYSIYLATFSRRTFKFDKNNNQITIENNVRYMNYKDTSQTNENLGLIPYKIYAK